MNSPMRTHFSRILPIASLSTLLVACTVGPSFKRPSPDVPTAWSAIAPPVVSPASQVTTAPADAAHWWTSFNDAELTSLINRAAGANLDAKEAVLRIAEARAQRDVSKADEWPSLDANASAQINRLSDTTPTGALFNKVGEFPGLTGINFPNPYYQYQVGWDASWEIDLFGRVRRSVEAADANAQATVEDSRRVLISTLGDVGRAYIDLRGAQAKRAATLETIAIARELLDLAA